MLLGNANDDDLAKVTMAFHRLGGTQLLINALEAIHSRLRSMAAIQKQEDDDKPRTFIRQQDTLLVERRVLFDVACNLLACVREVCYSLQKLAAKVLGSDRALATIINFCRYPSTANVAIYAGEEVVLFCGRLVTFAALRASGCDALRLFMALSPADLAVASRLVALMVFDGRVQDPSQPLKAKMMITRSRETATHASEQILVDGLQDAPGSFSASGAGMPLVFLEPTPAAAATSPSTHHSSSTSASSTAPFISVSHAVDANIRAVIAAGDGLLLRRLVDIVGSPPPPDGFGRVAAVVSGLQGRGDRMIAPGHAIAGADVSSTAGPLLGGLRLAATGAAEEVDRENTTPPTAAATAASVRGAGGTGGVAASTAAAARRPGAGLVGSAPDDEDNDGDDEDDGDGDEEADAMLADLLHDLQHTLALAEGTGDDDDVMPDLEHAGTADDGQGRVSSDVSVPTGADGSRAAATGRTYVVSGAAGAATGIADGTGHEGVARRGDDGGGGAGPPATTVAGADGGNTTDGAGLEDSSMTLTVGHVMSLLGTASFLQSEADEAGVERAAGASSDDDGRTGDQHQFGAAPPYTIFNVPSHRRRDAALNGSHQHHHHHHHHEHEHVSPPSESVATAPQRVLLSTLPAVVAGAYIGDGDGSGSAGDGQLRQLHLRSLPTRSSSASLPDDNSRCSRCDSDALDDDDGVLATSAARLDALPPLTALPSSIILPASAYPHMREDDDKYIDDACDPDAGDSRCHRDWAELRRAAARWIRPATLTKEASVATTPTAAWSGNPSPSDAAAAGADDDDTAADPDYSVDPTRLLAAIQIGIPIANMMRGRGGEGGSKGSNRGAGGSGGGGSSSSAVPPFSHYDVRRGAYDAHGQAVGTVVRAGNDVPGRAVAEATRAAAATGGATSSSPLDLPPSPTHTARDGGEDDHDATTDDDDGTASTSSLPPLPLPPPPSTSRHRDPKDIFDEDDVTRAGDGGGGGNGASGTRQAPSSAPLPVPRPAGGRSSVTFTSRQEQQQQHHHQQQQQQQPQLGGDGGAALTPQASSSLGSLGSQRLALMLATIQPRRSEAIFVLASLMAGTGRRQLQDFIAAAGGLAYLARALVSVDWLFDPGASNPPPRLHGPTCECRPETEGAIQLLRLTLCVADRDCESCVHRWLPRRRFMTGAEVRRAFKRYGRGSGGGTGASDFDGHDDGDASPVDESSVLLEGIRLSSCRPWGWSVEQPGNGSNGSNSGSGKGCHDAGSKLVLLPVGSVDQCVRAAHAAVWGHDRSALEAGLSSDAAPSAPPPLLVLADPVLTASHRNSSGRKPFDVNAIDSDSDVEDMGAGLGYGSDVHDHDGSDALRLQAAGAGEPWPTAAVTTYEQLKRAQHRPSTELDPRVSIDAVITALPPNNQIVTALEKARDARNPAVASAAELHGTGIPRGTSSLLLTALVLASQRSPYRGWLSSVCESFLRGAPLPVRQWAGGHGLATYLVHRLLTEHAVKFICAAHGMAAPEDRDRPTTSTVIDQEASQQHASRIAATRAHYASATENDAHVSEQEAGRSDHQSDTDVDTPHSHDHHGGHGSEDDDEEESFSLQGMFDTLADVVRRNRDGLLLAMEADANWAASVIPGLRQHKHQRQRAAGEEGSTAAAAAATAGDGSDAHNSSTSFASPDHATCTAHDVDQAVAGSPIMRLACSRLPDAAVFIRCLLASEDWAHGAVAAEAVVNVASPLDHVADDAGASERVKEGTGGTGNDRFSGHKWSLRSLAESTVRITAPATSETPTTATPPPWYGCIDETALSTTSLSFLRQYRIPLLYGLMQSVSLDTVQQDNLCVVSTALLVFVTAHRHGGLPALVRHLHDYDAHVRAWGDGDAWARANPPLRLPTLSDDLLPPAVHGQRFGAEGIAAGECGVATAGLVSSDDGAPAPGSQAPGCPALGVTSGSNSPVLRSFARCLVFWLEYHSLRDRDRRALAVHAMYSYPEWRVVARGLLGLDVHAPPTAAVVDMGLLPRTKKAAALEEARMQQWVRGSPVGGSGAVDEYWRASRLLPETSRG